MNFYESEAIKAQGYEFVAKTKEIAQELGFKANWLFAIMYQESRFTTNVFSADGYYSVGLIQITDQNWRNLFGITSEQASRLSALQQLDYVKKFYYPYKNKIKSFADLYVFNFGSAFLYQPDSSIMATGQTAIYTCGKKDGICSKADFKNFVTERYIKQAGEHPDKSETENTILEIINPENYTNFEKVLFISFFTLLVIFIINKI